MGRPRARRPNCTWVPPPCAWARKPPSPSSTWTTRWCNSGSRRGRSTSACAYFGDRGSFEIDTPNVRRHPVAGRRIPHRRRWRSQHDHRHRARRRSRSHRRRGAFTVHARESARSAALETFEPEIGRPASGRIRVLVRDCATAAKSNRNPCATFRARPSATKIWTSTARGGRFRRTAGFGRRRQCRLDGRPTATATGCGWIHGAGRGSTTRPGASRPSTTAAGRSRAPVGSGCPAPWWCAPGVFSGAGGLRGRRWCGNGGVVPAGSRRSLPAGPQRALRQPGRDRRGDGGSPRCFRGRAAGCARHGDCAAARNHSGAGGWPDRAHGAGARKRAGAPCGSRRGPDASGEGGGPRGVCQDRSACSAGVKRGGTADRAPRRGARPRGRGGASGDAACAERPAACRSGAPRPAPAEPPRAAPAVQRARHPPRRASTGRACRSGARRPPRRASTGRAPGPPRPARPAEPPRAAPAVQAPAARPAEPLRSAPAVQAPPARPAEPPQAAPAVQAPAARPAEPPQAAPPAQAPPARPAEPLRSAPAVQAPPTRPAEPLRSAPAVQAPPARPAEPPRAAPPAQTQERKGEAPGVEKKSSQEDGEERGAEIAVGPDSERRFI